MNKVQLSRSTQKNLSNLGRALAKQFDRDLQEVDQNIDSMITLGTKSEEIELSSDQVLRQLNRFKKTPLFGKWQTNPEMNPEKWELALALRCSPDSPTSVWLRRIETLRAGAQISNDSEVLRFIEKWEPALALHIGL
jgi:mRNA-degrading endonuclease RelE of RelBE toxin-antitoxin system